MQLGTTFTSYGWVPKDADHRNDVEVTAFDAPRTIEFTGREKGEDFRNTYVLTTQGGGTRIDRTLDFPKPDGIDGAFFPLVLGGFIKPATNKGMKMLKANLENGTSRPAPVAHPGTATCAACTRPPTPRRGCPRAEAPTHGSC